MGDRRVSTVKRVGDDSRLRPFLSSHFNPQEFIKGVIREGRSEDVFKEIVSYIEDVNEEIKSYITQHKDSLMSGMQDVATLAERYATLSTNSQKLHRNVERLKKEALQSYDLVKMRTAELERIHSASTTLRYLRQFSHAKAQLDHVLKGNEAKPKGGQSIFNFFLRHSLKSTPPPPASTADGSDAATASNAPAASISATAAATEAHMDIRQLATAAKTINELEGLLDLPALAEISMVAEHALRIRQFGQQLRRRAQDRLLAALKERDQASVASSLQVFFNLQSLPEVILLAIDATVRQTVDISRASIDLDAVVAAYPELASVHTATRAAAVAAVLGGAGPRAGQGPASSSQVRVSLREVAHQWASAVHEQAMQIHVLQRVVSKKEDPTTHRRFLEVLRVRVGNGAAATTGNQSLAAGRLLDLFWERLKDSLQEMATEKIKTQPIASNRIYPYLHRAAVEIVQNLAVLSARDLARDAQGVVAFSGLTAPQVAGGGAGSAGLAQDGGMFGSLSLPQDELLGLLGVTKRRSRQKDRDGARDRSARGAGEALGGGPEQGLVKGLGPMRDRYLVGCFNRMVHPITQMFPEMEGYTAAVPSKRDLLALTKALHTELVSAAIESEVGLVRAVCREAHKAVQLMVTKVEGMILNSPEAQRISPLNNFAKTSSQEHNALLVSLLAQLKEALDKMPLQVLKAAQEAPGGSLGVTFTGSSEDVGMEGAGAGAGEASAEATLAGVLAELSGLAAASSATVEELTSRQLLAPLVTALSAHVKSLLFGLPKEGVAQSQAPSSSASAKGSGAEVECSRAVQTAVKQLPELIKAHLAGLPKSPLVTEATEELCLRVMHAYVSAASLVRPVTEASRLRTAKDMGALEVVVSTCAPGVNLKEACPVVQEFK